MAKLASFWVGNTLGPIEQASLRSFLRHGDEITVYSPAPIAELPKGVLWANSAEILPNDPLILHHKTKSPALHSDFFRMQLMAKTDQIWVDLDIVALKPFDFGSEWVFGYESEKVVNGAVLRLPAGSETLARMMQITPETRGLPPHIHGFRRFKYRLKGGLRGLPVTKWPWGSLGPRLLTTCLQETGEIRHTRPIEAFYAVPSTEAARFVTPGAVDLSRLSSETWALHLWGKELRQELKRLYNGTIPAGSFLDLALKGEI